VLPFAVFIAILAASRFVPLPEVAVQALWVIVMAGVLWFSRDAIDFKAPHLLSSALLGLAVFLIWIGPDALFPAYRQSWLFQNSVIGYAKSSLGPEARLDPWVLMLRSVRAVLIVPVVEELFWRAWLMRWLIHPRFEKVPLGAFTPLSFAITAVLFASEHGSFWDVGLVAGILYNWWMLRTKRLGDCILAHAVTNACLCGYVIATHHWKYWL